jgi:nucleoside phosphorylase
MLRIVVALLPEASPLISLLGLKRDMDARPFHRFYGGNVELIVSGMGKVRSACAVSDACAKSRPGKSDLWLNVGICGAHPSLEFPIGQTLLANRIHDRATRRNLFPDIAVAHAFAERSITTVDAPQCVETAIAAEFVEMEASGFFQSALLHVSTSQIACLKIVSDLLTPGSLNREFIGELVANSAEQVMKYATAHHSWLQATAADSSALDCAAALTERAAIVRRFTVSQKRLLQDQIHAYLVRGNAAETIEASIPANANPSKQAASELLGNLARVCSAT